MRSLDASDRMLTDLRLKIDKPDVIIRPDVADIGLLDVVDVCEVAKRGGDCVGSGFARTQACHCLAESLAPSFVGRWIMKRDLRAYARQTNVQLAFGAFVLLFIIGLGLIWWIYGLGAAITGLLCLLGALCADCAYFLALFGMDWIVKRANSK